MNQTMFCKKLRRVGQSTAEYAVLLAVVAAAIISMQIYIKRGVQGRIRDLSDQICDVSNHYEKGSTNSTFITDQSGNSVTSYSGGVTTTYSNDITNRTGGENSKPEEQ